MPFLRDHPDAPEAGEARERIDWLKEDAAYGSAVGKNDEAGYRDFLQSFPKSRAPLTGGAFDLRGGVN